jgi:hypothetical protein
VIVGGTPRLLFDLFGVAATTGLALVVLRSTLQNTIHLYRAERLD